MPRATPGNPPRSLRRSSHAGRSKAVSAVWCLLPRDLERVAACKAPDLAATCAMVPVPAEDGLPVGARRARGSSTALRAPLGADTCTDHCSAFVPSSAPHHPWELVMAAVGCELMHTLTRAARSRSVPEASKRSTEHPCRRKPHRTLLQLYLSSKHCSQNRAARRAYRTSTRASSDFASPPRPSV